MNQAATITLTDEQRLELERRMSNLAATVISLAILEKAAPRFSSCRPLRCWILAPLE